MHSTLYEDRFIVVGKVIKKWRLFLISFSIAFDVGHPISFSNSLDL